jgi:hypothetical protein
MNNPVSAAEALAPEPVIVNRVAASGLINLNLEDLRPAVPVTGLDIKDQLFMGLVLREKDFRAFVQACDWTQYAGQAVALYCSADAIVPTWAYMLLASRLAGVAHCVAFAQPEVLAERLFLEALAAHDWAQYVGQRVVLKGCGEVPPSLYVEATRRLTPVVRTLMFGEPCSTVPIYKAAATQAPVSA